MKKGTEQEEQGAPLAAGLHAWYAENHRVFAVESIMMHIVLVSEDYFCMNLECLGLQLTYPDFPMCGLWLPPMTTR